MKGFFYKLLYHFAEYRGLGSSLTTAFSYICAFVGVKTFVDLRESLGLHGIFWTYAIISAFGFLFSLAFVPETKGLNLDEMMPKTSILTASNSVNSQANSEATSTTSRSSTTSVTSTSSTDEPCHSSSSSRYVWKTEQWGIKSVLDIFYRYLSLWCKVVLMDFVGHFQRQELNTSLPIAGDLTCFAA